MDNALRICELIEVKKQLFCEFESETRKIADCTIDEVEAHVSHRQRIIDEINRLDAQITGVCEEDVQMLDAVHNRCAHGDLPERLQTVFVAAQEVFAVASRAQTADERAMMRIREERDELQEKIRANNRGMEAQAAKFYSGESSIGAGGARFGNA